MLYTMFLLKISLTKPQVPTTSLGDRLTIIEK